LAISEREQRGVQVRGWIGRAGVSRQTRAQQFVFVNGRPIESGILATALREGYQTALMRGQFPVTCLFVDLDPQDVDVNVHPAKREVRFRDPARIREAIVEAVQRTLESGRIDWQRKFSAPVPGGTTAVSSQASLSKPDSPPPVLLKQSPTSEIMGRHSARPSTSIPQLPMAVDT